MTNLSTRARKPLSRKEVLESHRERLYELRKRLICKDNDPFDLNKIFDELEKQMQEILADENLTPLHSFSTYLHQKTQLCDVSREELAHIMEVICATISDLINADDEHLRHWLG